MSARSSTTADPAAVVRLLASRTAQGLPEVPDAATIAAVATILGAVRALPDEVQTVVAP